MLVVERSFVGPRTANEAAIPETNIVNEPLCAKINYLAVLIDDRTVFSLSPRHPNFLT